MKKQILRSLSGLIILAALTLPACELIFDECGYCSAITIDGDGNIISEGAPLLECGESYQNKLNSSSVPIGDNTTYWDCDDYTDD
jgi:hypothetical protein